MVALLAALAAGGALPGCETILPWPEDGGEDGGKDGGENPGDGGSGAWLSSFGPGVSYVRAPADGGATYPTALEVRILRGGESGPVRVDISSSNPALASAAGGGVVVAAGSTQATVPIISSAVGSATLTARFDGGSLQALVTSLPTVVISEVAAESITDSNDEMVELYNPTALDFSLAGCVVQYHSNNTGSPYLEVVTLDGGARIAPHSYFLVGVNNYGTPAPDARSTWGGGAFSGSAGSVRLGAPGVGTEPTDVLALDTVGWGSSSVSFEGAPFTGTLIWGSLERKARASSTAASMSTGADSTSGNARDTGDNSADLVNRTSRNPQNSSSPAEIPP